MASTHDRRLFNLRLGVREYTISEDEYMNPGQLVDSLLCDEICEKGGFIVSNPSVYLSFL